MNENNEIEKFHANGKLMITGEYLVLKGAEALALPTIQGQDLFIQKIEEKRIYWSTLVENEYWFSCEFSVPDLQIITTNNREVAETLQSIFYSCKTMNLNVLQSGYNIKSEINFNLNWGLGSSSSLISVIAQWLKVNAYDLNRKIFKGSGYDIACASVSSPLIYSIKSVTPLVKDVSFNPVFKEHLYFIWLNKKQDTRSEIVKLDGTKNYQLEVAQINALTLEFASCHNLRDFQQLMLAHEKIISKVIGSEKIQHIFFPDFKGAIKSLGAWGGDFIMAASKKTFHEVEKYFNQKGFTTVLRWNDLFPNKTD